MSSDLETMIDRVLQGHELGNGGDSWCPLCDYDGIWQTRFYRDEDKRDAVRALLLKAMGIKE